MGQTSFHDETVACRLAGQIQKLAAKSDFVRILVDQALSKR